MSNVHRIADAAKRRRRLERAKREAARHLMLPTTHPEVERQAAEWVAMHDRMNEAIGERSRKLLAKKLERRRLSWEVFQVTFALERFAEWAEDLGVARAARALDKATGLVAAAAAELEKREKERAR